MDKGIGINKPIENEMNMLREIFRLERKVAELELEIDRLRSQNSITYPWGIDGTGVSPISYEYQVIGLS